LLFSWNKKKSFLFKRNFFCLEQANEFVDNVKQTAHDVSVKAEELEQTVEEKLVQAENVGRKFYFLLFYFDLILTIKVKKNLKK